MVNISKDLYLVPNSGRNTAYSSETTSPYPMPTMAVYKLNYLFKNFNVNIFREELSNWEHCFGIIQHHL